MTYPIDLFELLPTVHRREDAEVGHPLETLLDILSGQAQLLQQDIAGLWDDFFIETASEWVIPYIADLVGSTPLHRVAASWRADVANTIRYRRRKGTVSMLEELAADVTGWGARVVPFFEILEWSQYLDHRRRDPAAHPGRSDRVGTVNLGNVDALDRLGGPFDAIARSVDVRPFGANRGRHNIKKIGFFLWRLRSNPLAGVTPRQSTGHPNAYHISPIGNAAPLFTNDERPSRETRPSEADVPGPIRRLALHLDLEAAAAAATTAVAEAVAAGASTAHQELAALAAGGESLYYGAKLHHSLGIAVGDPGIPFPDQLIPAFRVSVCDLATWRPPRAGKLAAVDPVRGRLVLAPEAAPAPGHAVRVRFCFGFSGAPGADVGGGAYDRHAEARDPDDEPIAQQAVGKTGQPFTTIASAIASWLAEVNRPDRAVVEIQDGATYDEGTLTIELPADAHLEIRAAEGTRPVVDVAGLTVRRAASAAGAGEARLVVDGLAVIGSPLRIGPGIDQVELRHTTLVPGREFRPNGTIANPSAASILAAGAAAATVVIANSIVGPIRLPAEGWTVIATDSIVDSPAGETAIGGPAGAYGPTCDLRRVTVLGDVVVRSIGYASDVLFLDRVVVERTQAGCLRFSYVADDARTPRRYRCQPDLALAGATTDAARRSIRSYLRPRFTSRVYGQPGYGQLASDAATELKTGGEHESEIGALSRVQEAQRIANLRIRLDEYLPAGLEPGLIFAT
jgi:hypothetical protein